MDHNSLKSEFLKKLAVHRLEKYAHGDDGKAEDSVVSSNAMDARPKKKGDVQASVRAPGEIKSDLEYYRKSAAEARRLDVSDDIIEGFEERAAELEAEYNEARKKASTPDANGNVHIVVRFRVVPEEVKDEKKDDLLSTEEIAQDDAIRSSELKTPFEKCKAQNPIRCRYHGRAAMNYHFQKILEEHGLPDAMFAFPRISESDEGDTYQLDFDCPKDKAATIGKAIIRAFGEIEGIDLIDPDDALSMVEYDEKGSAYSALFDIMGKEDVGDDDEPDSKTNRPKPRPDKPKPQPDKPVPTPQPTPAVETKRVPDVEKKDEATTLNPLHDLPIAEALARDELNAVVPSAEKIEAFDKEETAIRERKRILKQEISEAFEKYAKKYRHFNRVYEEVAEKLGKDPEDKLDIEVNGHPDVIAASNAYVDEYNKYLEISKKEDWANSDKTYSQKFFDFVSSCGFGDGKTIALSFGKVNPSRKKVVSEAAKIIGRIYSRDVIPTVPVNVNATRQKRSYYGLNNTLYLYAKGKEWSCVHEYGHFVEDNNEHVHKRCIEFLEYRTRGEKAEKMRKVMSNRRYGSDERVKPDHFLHPYCGRIYGGDGDIYATEILSMGTEFLLTCPAEFYRKDPEYFKFICGIVRGVL